MDGINLAKIVASESDISKKFVWVDFKGIRFKIRYISRATMQAMAESCMVIGYDPRSKSHQRRLDAEKFVKEVSKTLVHDWENCTLRNLSNLMPLSLGEVEQSKLDELVPFTQENLLMVVQNVHELDNFLQECAVDASMFKNPLDEALTKNSSNSQSGS